MKKKPLTQGQALAGSVSQILTGVRIDPKKIAIARGDQLTIACHENGDVLITLGRVPVGKA